MVKKSGLKYFSDFDFYFSVRHCLTMVSLWVLVMALLRSNHACYGGGKWPGNLDHYLEEEEGGKRERKRFSFHNKGGFCATLQCVVRWTLLLRIYRIKKSRERETLLLYEKSFTKHLESYIYLLWLNYARKVFVTFAIHTKSHIATFSQISKEIILGSKNF